jgi:hypothetical protein
VCYSYRNISIVVVVVVVVVADTSVDGYMPKYGDRANNKKELAQNQEKVQKGPSKKK